MILYSPPKVGKTQSLAQLDDCLIIDLERGTKRYDAMAVEASSYQDLQDILVALATEYRENGNQFVHKFGAIDTLDILEDIAIHKAAEFYGQTPMGKAWFAKNYVKPGVLKPDGEDILSLPNGAGYGWLRQAMIWYVDVFKKFFKYLILTTHVKDKRLASIDGTEEVIVKDISLTGRMGSILSAKADAIGYMYRDTKGQLMVSYQTNDITVMGSRCPHLAGQKFLFDWQKIYID